jgi:hypothetical protein
MPALFHVLPPRRGPQRTTSAWSSFGESLVGRGSWVYWTHPTYHEEVELVPVLVLSVGESMLTVADREGVHRMSVNRVSGVVWHDEEEPWMAPLVASLFDSQGR